MDMVGQGGVAILLHQPAPLLLAAARFNIAIDLAIVAIPIPNLLRLKLGLRRKLFLVAIFSVGAM